VGLLLSGAWLAGIFFLAFLTTLPLATLLWFTVGTNPIIMAALIPLALFLGCVLLFAFLWAFFSLLPQAPNGAYDTGASRSYVLWAIENGLAIPVLRLFQPLVFVNESLRYLVLRALHADVAYSAMITSRTVITNPRKIHVGEGSIVGEGAHMSPAHQPRIGKLVVGDIRVGKNVLVGGYTKVMAGTEIADNVIIQADCFLHPFCKIGGEVRLGRSTIVNEGAVVGARSRIGRGCEIAPYAVVPEGTILKDGEFFSAGPGGLRKRFATAPAEIVQPGAEHRV